MNHGRRKPRRDLSYDDPVDCGIFTLSKDRKQFDDTRTVSQVNRIPSAVATYALFAGHAGSTASELCARNFVPTLLEDPLLKADPERAIRNTCDALEAFVLAKSALDRAYYGTTVLFVMLKGSTLYVANIGNSRAVLASRDGVEPLTAEHDETNKEEVVRVQSTGGFFQRGKVNNLLRVTRSIGDLELKGRKHITFPHLPMSADVVIPDPDIHSRRLSSRDDFLVMATPEVWQHLSNDAVVQIVRNSLRRRETSRFAAKRVATAAVTAGAVGPVTVMLLVFSIPRGIDEDERDEKVKEELPSTERRRTSARPLPGKRLASNAARQLRAKGKWPAPTSAPTSPATSTTRRAKDIRREDSHTRVVDMALTSPMPSPLPSGGERLRRATEKQRSGLKEGRNDDTVVMPALHHLSHHHDAVATDPFASPDPGLLEHGSGSVGTISRQRLERAQSELVVEKSVDIDDLGTDEMGDLAGADHDAVLRNSFLAVERRQSHTSGHRHVGRRSKTKSKELAYGHRTGSGAWPVSDLTSSGATGGPSSQLSMAEVERSVGDLLDHGIKGPSKVRYRDDGTTQHGRLAFFRDFGWALGRRR